MFAAGIPRLDGRSHACVHLGAEDNFRATDDFWVVDDFRGPDGDILQGKSFNLKTFW